MKQKHPTKQPPNCDKRQSQIIDKHKLSAGALFGATVLFSILSFGATAEASSVLSCKGASAAAVTSCCEQMVSESGLPSWMSQSKSSCRKATVCRKGSGGGFFAAKVAKPCYIQSFHKVKLDFDKGGHKGKGKK